jgi:hypothetical protein
MAQVAAAAHALHEAGVIHRDIKPGNVMVTADGAQAVLMDLGLAQLADSEEGRLTRTRQFVGTLRYASPEQVLAVARLDRRSDVYSLGATLWELLTLRPLFGATEQTPTPELMQRIQYEEPDRLRKYHPGLPRDLEAIVGKCLQKDARRRYATAQEVARELRGFLDGNPVRARPVSGVERGWRWAKRRPALAALLAVLLLASVAFVVGGVLYTAHLGEAKQSAEGQKKIAEKALADVEEALERVKGAETKAREEGEAAKKARDKTIEGLAVGNLRLADAYWQQGNVTRAQELLDEVPAEPAGLRQWEWRYLKRRFAGSYCTLYGHTDAVASVTFSGDGLRLASASADGTVKVWDARSGAELLTLRGHGGPVSSVSFSADGRRIATASGDGTVKVWDARGSAELFVLRGHPERVTRVLFSPDGQQLISQDGQGRQIVWDLVARQPVPRDANQPTGSGPGAISPDRKRLALGANDGSIRIIDLRLPDAEELTFREGMARLDPHWQAEQATHYAEAKQWFAAAFHLRWLKQVPPADGDGWYRLGLVQLVCGDAAGYRLTFTRMCERFSGSSKADPVRATIGLAVLTPNTVSDPATWVQLAERAAGKEPDSGARFLLGAALHRAGRHVEAVKWLNEVVQKHGEGGAAEAQLFLAMAHHCLGRADEAKQWLARAAEQIDRAKSPPWTDRVVWQMLQQEAEALIRPKPPAVMEKVLP